MNYLWALGYCFGAFEAFMQRARLDQYTDGLALLTIGFQKVMGVSAFDGDMDAADKLGLALDKQNDVEFVAGRKVGGSEFYDWLIAPKWKPPPMGLSTWLKS